MVIAKFVEDKLLEKIEKAELCINIAGAYDLFSHSEIKTDIVGAMKTFTTSGRSAV